MRGIYELPWIKPLARIMRVIPISSELRPRAMIQSLKEARQAILDGDVVCIFAEGQITRIGQMLPFRRGFERIMKDVDAPIIPVSLMVCGAAFSVSSEAGSFGNGRGAFLSGDGVIWQADAVEFTALGSAPSCPGTGCGSLAISPVTDAPLHRALSARPGVIRFDSPWRMSELQDSRSARLSRGPSFWPGACNRSGRTRHGWSSPASVSRRGVGQLRRPVDGQDSRPSELHAVRNGARVVSPAMRHQDGPHLQKFLEQGKLKVACPTVVLEELAERAGFGEKLVAFLMAKVLPAGLLEKALGAPKKVELDDLATVIFSSGSTGDPKGVMLSHYNIGSNIEQLGQTFALGSKDRLLGVLPFFHSFGFTGTLCLPAALGLGVVYHPNPLDARSIGELVNAHAATMLVATPTFLQIYLRGCAPEQFGSLQFVLVGAEKLSERVATEFAERFGVRPFEAYGCTECAPAVTVNTRDFRAAGFRQVGAKRGKIGHPLPGVSVKIVDPETMQTLPIGHPGMLLVRGPNVMRGYLGRPEKTAEVLRDGWYVTGDIAALDRDGFLEITDRMSRFSKVGGEMVPHVKVEESLHRQRVPPNRRSPSQACPMRRKASVWWSCTRCPKES